MTHRDKSAVDPASSGSVALEYGLILPALLLLVLGTMEIGRLIWTYTTLIRAVEASARCAAINPALCGSTAQIASRAASEAFGLTLQPSIFTSRTQACGVEVTASYNYALLIPWPQGDEAGRPPNSIVLSVTACYPL